ncbi:MAG: ribbon-helix-helix protein, CopG family [bacterium]
MRASVNLGETQLRALDQMSKEVGRSRATLIREAVDDYLAKRRKACEDEAFGLWGKRRVDGLAYQEHVRREW